MDTDTPSAPPEESKNLALIACFVAGMAVGGTAHLLLAGTYHSAAPACPTLEASALQKLVQEASAAASSATPAKLLEMHTDDALVIGASDDIWIKDHAGIAKDLNQFMRYQPKVTFRSEVQKISCTSAWSAGHVDMELRDPKSGKIYKETDRYTMIFTYIGTRWKISHIHFSQPTKSRWPM